MKKRRGLTRIAVLTLLGGNAWGNLGAESRAPENPTPAALWHTYVLPLPAASGQPASMASADGDGDGLEDLLIGTNTGDGGQVLLLRTRPAAVYPNWPAGRTQQAPPFAAASILVSVDRPVDHLLVGDFDGDGNIDLLLAPARARRVRLLYGRGPGGFSQARFVPLPGPLREAAVGEWGRPDGIADLALSWGQDRALHWGVIEGRLDRRAAVSEVVSDRWPAPKRPAASPAHGAATSSLPMAVLPAAPATLLPAAAPRRQSEAGSSLRHGWTARRGAVSASSSRTLAMAMRLSPDAVMDVVRLHQTEPPRIEVTRSVAVATITVNDTGDSDSRDGVVTLREAMLLAEGTLAVGTLDGSEAGQVTGVPAAAQLDEIRFDIPGPGPHTIAPTQQLPTLADAVTIDGTSEPDFAATPVVVLDGSLTGGANALQFNGGSSLIRGLVIHSFFGLPNVGSAVTLSTLGGNIVEGNFIGIDVTGTSDLGNEGNGVHIFESSANRVGGTVAAARNVISGQDFPAISINGTGATDNVIEGNLIGTDASGTVVIGNDTNNLQIANGASGNTIGGTTAAAANVISGNLALGNPNIAVTGINGGASSTGNLIQGNLIGTDITGSVELGNASVGLFIANNAPGNAIGGAAAGAGNVIAGSGLDGIRLGSSSSSGNVIEGNTIGTDAAGMLDFGNGLHGIFLTVSPSATRIGGTAAGSGNVIAFNASRGVFIDSGSGNSVRGNAVFGNGDLAVDLCSDFDSVSQVCNDVVAVTGNDAGDLDGGANDLLNFPSITGVVPAASSSIVEGSYDGAANENLDLDFYANAACDPSGHGEAERFLGSGALSTGPTGSTRFRFELAGSVTVGEAITASATDTAGSTSELSACSPATAGADLSVALMVPGAVAENGTFDARATVHNAGDDDASAVVLEVSTPAGATFVSATPGAPTCQETAGSVTCDWASLPAKESREVRIGLAVTAAPGSMLTTAASAAANEVDPDLSQNETSGTSRVDAVLFADGFESGTVSAWSSTT